MFDFRVNSEGNEEEKDQNGGQKEYGYKEAFKYRSSSLLYTATPVGKGDGYVDFLTSEKDIPVRKITSKENPLSQNFF